MTHSKLLAFGLLLAALSASAQASDSDANTRYDAARDQYEIGHYDDAFRTFAALADAGHCSAIRMAAQMARQGRALYATDFKVEPQRLAGWTQQTHCALAQKQLTAKR